MNLRSKILTSVLALNCLPALAHEEAPPQSVHALVRDWEFDPLVVVALLLSGWLYVRGIRKLWKVLGKGKGIRRWEVASFLTGWLFTAFALVSPLHAWGQALFSAHMVQHEILMLLAAPLFVLGRPVIAWLKAIPLTTARKAAAWGNSSAWRNFWSSITYPLAAWVIHAVALWVWHIPLLFQATLNNDLIHSLQHVSFLFSALLFWWALMHGRARLSGYGLAVLYVFTTAMHTGLLGALITFAGKIIYPDYAATTSAWGLSPLEDQQLGGLVMWIPAGLVYVVAGLALFAAWLRESESRVQRYQSVLRNDPLFKS